MGGLIGAGGPGQHTDCSASGTGVHRWSSGQVSLLPLPPPQVTALPWLSLSGEPETQGLRKVLRLRHSGLVGHRKSGQPSSRRRMHSSPAGHGYLVKRREIYRRWSTPRKSLGEQRWISGRGQTNAGAYLFMIPTERARKSVGGASGYEALIAFYFLGGGGLKKLLICDERRMDKVVVYLLFRGVGKILRFRVNKLMSPENMENIFWLDSNLDLWVPGLETGEPRKFAKPISTLKSFLRLMSYWLFEFQNLIHRSHCHCLATQKTATPKVFIYSISVVQL